MRMMTFKSYDHAVRAGYGPYPSCPPDYPDPPDLWQIDPEYYRSECCGRHGTIHVAKNGANICENCCKFCRIDHTATLEAIKW